MGRGSIQTRLAAVTAVLIMVIGGVIWTSAQSTSVDHERALVNNVAGRQPVLTERYLAEVLLVSHGFRADPEATKSLLAHNADALLDGGAVLAVQGNDKTIHMAQQRDPSVRAKLSESIRLIDALSTIGDRIATEQPDTAAYRADVDQAQALSHVTANVQHDAVGRMTTLAARAVETDAKRQIVLAAIGIVLALGLSVVLGRHLVGRLGLLTLAAGAAAAGDLSVRYEGSLNDEVGLLGGAFNDMADNLAHLLGRLEAQAEGDKFRNQLAEALEVTDQADQAYRVIELALQEIDPGMSAELLLADSSRAHVTQVATSPDVAPPNCPVESPFSCVAVRRGGPLVTPSSEALNACPSLRNRPGGPCSAVCVPVTFMGRALGVLHATGPDGEVPDARIVDQLTTLGVQGGARIGTVRSFQESQLQASTDGLTGLLNRRSLENQLRNVIKDREPFSLAMVDLDHFKQLNDTYGHEAGDRALRVFGQVLREAVRTGDIVARYGGEEFVLVFRGVLIDEATELLDRLRVVMAAAVQSSGGPAFTASFGLTDSTVGATVDELFRAADSGLLEAKAQGRNCVVPVRTIPVPAG